VKITLSKYLNNFEDNRKPPGSCADETREQQVWTLITDGSTVPIEEKIKTCSVFLLLREASEKIGWNFHLRGFDPRV